MPSQPQHNNHNAIITEESMMNNLARSAGVDYQRKVDPARFYDNLRRSSKLHNSRSSSQVVEVELADDEERIRLMHITQLLPVVDSSVFIYIDAPGFLALKHFNSRSNAVVSNLSKILDGCNIFLTMDMLDSENSPLVASSKLYNYFSRGPTVDAPQPAGIIGAALSKVSRPLAVLAGTYGVPIISPSTTSTTFDSNDLAPTFGRTIPTNYGEAEAIAEYFSSLGVTHFAMIYVQDEYGVSFRYDLEGAAMRRGIRVVYAAYRNGDPVSINGALKILKESQLHYMFAVFNPSTYDQVLEQAYDEGLVGHDYVWYLASIADFTETNYALNRKSQAKVAAAIQGAVVLIISNPPHPAFEESLSRLQTDLDFQLFFLNAHPEESAYANVNISEKSPVITPFSYGAYDALMALGIAACQTDDYFFTGNDLYQSFKNVTFSGASGYVAFDHKTGTREYKTMTYSFISIFVDEDKSTEETVVYKSRLGAVVDFKLGEPVKQIAPFIYNDGSTRAPNPLPEYVEDMNLISTGFRLFGWIFAGGLVICSLALICWVYTFRRKHIIRAAQPRFLIMILVGTFVMATSIIPASLQEPISQRGLDIACMATPWLFFLGFSTTFSAIYCKSVRISTVVQKSMDLEKVTVDSFGVLYTFTLLAVTNIMILTAWTVEAPWVWTRLPIENNFDSFGRSIETFGNCIERVDSDGGRSAGLSKLFVGALFAINIVVVAVACYKAYLTRNMPCLFNEAYQVMICMAIMLEGFLLGVPIKLLVPTDPTAYFVIHTLLITVYCIAIVCPIFVPKLQVFKQTAAKRGFIGSIMGEWASYVAHNSQSRYSCDMNDDTRMQSISASFGSSSRPSRRLPSSDGTLRVQRHSPGRTAAPLFFEEENWHFEVHASTVSQLRANIFRRSLVPIEQGMYPSSVAELRTNVARSVSCKSSATPSFDKDKLVGSMHKQHWQNLEEEKIEIE